MSVRFISSLAELQQLISQPKLTVVDFFATWCGPCQKIAPQIEQLARSKPHVNFCKVDVDKATAIMTKYPVRCMPTFRFFKNGNVVETFEGADINSVSSIVTNNEAIPPPPIPSDEALQAMKPSEILALMKQHHISAVGLAEKSELIEELAKYR